MSFNGGAGGTGEPDASCFVFGNNICTTSSAAAMFQPSVTLAPSSSATPEPPEGTGLLSTMTTRNIFNYPVTMEGRLFALQTTDAFGNTVTVQELVGASEIWTVTPSTSSTTTTTTTPTPSSTASAFITSDLSAGLPSSTPIPDSAVTSTPAESTAAVTSIAAAGAAASNAPAAPSSSHHGISGGAIAAAVIVPLVVIAILALLAAFLLRRRRRSRKLASDVSSRSFDGPQPTHYEKSGFVSSTAPYDSKDVYGTQDSTGASTLASSPTHTSASALQKALDDGNTLAPARSTTVAAAAPAVGTSALASTSPRGGPHGGSNTRTQNSNGISPEQSRGHTGRQSLDEEDAREDAVSVTSDGETEAEYHDAQLGSAAVGITQRASVINMIDARHGRGGSGSSGSSTNSQERQRR